MQQSLSYNVRQMRKKAVCNPKTSIIVNTLSHVGEQKSSEEFCNTLCSFFAFQYHCNVQPSITPFGKVPTLMPREVFDHTVANYTTLMACLYGLATGKAIRPIKRITAPNDQDFQSQYLIVSALKLHAKMSLKRNTLPLLLMADLKIYTQIISCLSEEVINEDRYKSVSEQSIKSN